MFGYLLKNLSVYHVRSHYLFYSLIRRLFIGAKINLANQSSRGDIQTYVSATLFARHVFLDEYDEKQAPYLFEHIMHGLYKNNLIESGFAFGSAEHISKFGSPSVLEPGVVFQPSVPGIELYLWISSLSTIARANTILSPEVSIPDLLNIDFKGFAFPLPERRIVL